jgi:hypothetical protein
MVGSDCGCCDDRGSSSWSVKIYIYIFEIRGAEVV